VARLACIDLPAFPLQLLLRREPAWADRPVVVIDEDRPQGRILWSNERARGFAILPGMRYAAGLALASELCAGVVPPREILDGVDAAAQVLRRFTPEVEPAFDDPGVFWANAAGLRPLHASLKLWGWRVRAALHDAGFLSRVVIGFSRFGTYALARSGRSVVVRSPEREEAGIRHVELDRLDLDPKARDALRALGVETVADLLKLPAGGLRARLGEEAYRLHCLARGEHAKPLAPQRVEEPLRREVMLDYSETDLGRLLFLIKRMLQELLAALVERRQALAGLTVELDGTHRETLRPADPTVDLRQVLDLVLLRLDTVELGEGVTEVSVDVEGVEATREQLELFSADRQRDRAAARRAFARLRAEFGDGAVCRAELSEGHLPEATFRWTPLFDLRDPEPRRVLKRVLVRRLLARPLALPHRPRQEDDGWQLRGRDDPAVEEVCGPYVVSGGWWRTERHREYHFLRNAKHDWLWVFFDRRRGRWFLHGRVE